ncbi:unnamed protein product [Phytophthora fragariaefolia]|uniref:Unnamed protein product n=1 Tax=Phytophthora fragariaefolia TaxID=1490495 RepID=A0A9W6U5Z8_9STRA|nr:unnamed protein product [Phytophthora fragariaefolia]
MERQVPVKKRCCFEPFLSDATLSAPTYHYQGSWEQSITLNLDNRHAQLTDSAASADNASVPIILSPPSTARFELSLNDFPTSFPSLEGVLSRGSQLTCNIKFKRPEVAESDYAWDNFQDQVVVHTKLSRLVICLEAWKFEVVSISGEQRGSLLFPASLPEVRPLSLRLFSAIERNAMRHRAPSSSLALITSTLELEQTNAVGNVSSVRTPRNQVLPSLSHPGSGDEQSSSLGSSQRSSALALSENVEQTLLPEVAIVQSQREARQVIMKLRCRRALHSNTTVPVGISPTAVTEIDLFPETVALDANTKAELEEFNNLVIAARDHVTKENAKAKHELSYYQQLLPVPPPRGSTPENPGPVVQKPRNTRQMSAATNRPSKLPSILRPSSSSGINAASMNNQEMSPLQRVPHRRKCSVRQRILRTTKLQSLSTSAEGLQVLQQQNSSGNSSSSTKLRDCTNNQLHEQVDELSDFDDTDPEVDDAPVLPDEVSGVAALDADEML